MRARSTAAAPGLRIVAGSSGRTSTSLRAYFASRLATDPAVIVGEMGEMGDAAPSRVDVIGSGDAAVRAYKASCCGGLWKTTRYRIALAAAELIVDGRARVQVSR